jgi:hypothetical protein
MKSTQSPLMGPVSTFFIAISNSLAWKRSLTNCAFFFCFLFFLLLQTRTFNPVILFHDHEFATDGSGHTKHIHISYPDPSYEPYIKSHKERIEQMLVDNGKYWSSFTDRHGKGSYLFIFDLMHKGTG